MSMAPLFPWSIELTSQNQQNSPNNSNITLSGDADASGIAEMNMARLIYILFDNKPLMFFNEIISNYTSHYNP